MNKLINVVVFLILGWLLVQVGPSAAQVFESRLTLAVALDSDPAVARRAAETQLAVLERQAVASAELLKKGGIPVRDYLQADLSLGSVDLAHTLETLGFKGTEANPGTLPRMTPDQLAAYSNLRSALKRLKELKLCLTNSTATCQYTNADQQRLEAIQRSRDSAATATLWAAADFLFTALWRLVTYFLLVLFLPLLVIYGLWQLWSCKGDVKAAWKSTITKAKEFLDYLGFPLRLKRTNTTPANGDGSTASSGAPSDSKKGGWRPRTKLVMALGVLFLLAPAEGLRLVNSMAATTVLTVSSVTEAPDSEWTPVVRRQMLSAVTWSRELTESLQNPANRIFGTLANKTTGLLSGAVGATQGLMGGSSGGAPFTTSGGGGLNLGTPAGGNTVPPTTEVVPPSVKIARSPNDAN